MLWNWHNAEHLLVSGSLNFLNGYIENAVLREFARYDDMWGMLEPADMPEVEGTTTTNVEGGATASNEGARLTSTTTVNIGGGGSIVLDTMMSDTSQNGVQNRVIKSYVDDIRSDLEFRLEEAEAYIQKAKRITDEFEVDEHGVRVKKNFRSDGELASGGVGEEGEIIEGDVYRMFHHKQTQPSAEWKIYHGLGKYPNVKIVDTLKQLCLGDVYYIDENNVTIKFGGAESGDAYLD